jgi:hypothetical protein
MKGVFFIILSRNKKKGGYTQVSKVTDEDSSNRFKERVQRHRRLLGFAGLEQRRG